MYSPITGTGTGAAPVVNITFPYLDQAHVKASVNGVDVAFTWTGASQITFSATVAAGAPWTVYRQTPIDLPLVDFTNGSVLTEQDLDLNTLQHLYIAQELDAARDALDASVEERARDALAAAFESDTIDWTIDDTGNVIHAEVINPSDSVRPLGLFTSASTRTIPATADRVRTSGHTVVGFGAADYVYDASINALNVGSAPLTQFLSANGRGFKLDASMGVNLYQTGGIADATNANLGTDNAAALSAAVAVLGVGGELRIPRGKFRMASRPSFTKTIRIVGTSSAENPGNVAGTIYSGLDIYDGSILLFDADVAGPIFYDATDNPNSTTFSMPADLKFFGARRAVIENILLLSRGGVGTTAHGLEVRSMVYARNVKIVGFAGNGLHIDASTSSNATPYGNADLSVFVNVTARQNKLHGYYVRGNDANVINFLGGDTALNGGAGVLDVSMLGNIYVGHHSATNNQSFGTPAGFTAAQRSYVTSTAGTTATQTGSAALADQYAGSYITTSAVGAHAFTGCYAETGQGWKHQIINPSVILGGNLASIGAATTAATATIINGGGGFYAPSMSLNAATLTINHGAGGAVNIINSAGGVAIARYMPGTGLFANLQLFGTGNSLAYGLDILAGQQQVSFSSDEFTFRNAAQTTNYWVANNTGFDVKTGVLKMNGTQVLGARKTGWTADTGTAKRTANATYSGTAEAAYTQATIQTLMNTVRDLSQTVKALKDDLISHGAIGT